MAEEKRKSLELIFAQTQEAKARLEALSQCGCRDLDECGRRIMRSSVEIPGLSSGKTSDFGDAIATDLPIIWIRKRP